MIYSNIFRKADLFVCVTGCGVVLTSDLHLAPRFNEWSPIVTPPIFLHDIGRDLTYIYRVSQEERSMFWEDIISVILSKNVYMNMCPIPNSFRDRAI